MTRDDGAPPSIEPWYRSLPMKFLAAALLTLAQPLHAADPGGRVPPTTVPAERSDANSREAHRQLLGKASAGTIDLYFLGDSITRRWGCTDPAHRALLGHWTTNFFGWNAANFGWGADGIEHMLWRIRNGELEGVHPKVIVLLAGTNNLGRGPVDARTVDDVVAGLGALVAACRELAPGARIILTGILPRNDGGLAAMPAIREINRRAAQLADGETVRFLDIGDRLAEPDGTLREGMTTDRLHLDVAGYQVWADALEPLLVELLGPRRTTDQAPPPTGDPKVTEAPEFRTTP